MKQGWLIAGLLILPAAVILAFAPSLANPFKTIKLCLLGLTTLFFLIAALRLSTFPVRISLPFVAAVLFFQWMCVCLSSPACINVWEGLTACMLPALGILIFFSCRSLCDEQTLIFILAGAACAGVVAGVYGIFQFVGIDAIRWDMPWTATSTLGRSNFAGECAASLVPWSLVLVVVSKGLLRRFFSASAVVLLVFLVITFSRASWVAGACSLCVFALAAPASSPRRTVGRILLATACAVVIAAALIGIRSHSIALRAAPQQSATPLVEQGTFRNRLLIWKIALRMVGRHPAVGVGPGHFAVLYPYYTIGAGEIVIAPDLRAGDAHNDYLECAAESGLPGVCLFILFAITLFTTGWRAARRSAGRRRVLLAGLLASFAAVLVNALAAFPLKNPPVAMVFWLAAAGIESLDERRGPLLVVQRKQMLFLAAAFALVWGTVSCHGIAGSLFFRRALRTERQNPSATLEAVERSLSHNPYNVWAMLCGARTALSQGDDPSAERYLNRAKDLNPFIDTIFVNLGVIEWRRKNFTMAEANFRYALMLNPHKVEALHNLGLLYLSQRRFKEAASLLSRARDLRPESSQIREHLARCLDEEKKAVLPAPEHPAPVR